MKISIIITTYNREKWILRTVNSILIQNYNNLEIIIVDNASTDSTVQLIKQLNSDKVHIIVNDKNYERSYSRNIGLKNFTGDYVTFLDSDDILFNHAFDLFLKSIKDYGYISIIAFKVAYIDEFDHIIKNIYYPKTYDNLNHILSSGNYLSNIGKFVRKDYAKKYLFLDNKQIIGVEDYEYNLRLTKESFDGVLVNSIIAGITIHDNRSTHNENFNDLKIRTLYLIELVKTNPNLYFTNEIYLSKFINTNLKFIISHLKINNLINFQHAYSFISQYNLFYNFSFILFIAKRLLINIIYILTRKI